MNKKHLLILVLAGVLVFGNTQAEENSGETTVNVEVTTTAVVETNADGTTGGGIPPRIPVKPVRDARQDIIKTRIENRDVVKDLRQEKFEDLKDTRVDNRNEIKTLIEENRALPVGERMEGREEIKTERDKNREEMRTKREEMKKSLAEKRAELKNELHQKMQVRFDAMVARFNTLITRMESRMDKMTAEGKDVSASVALVAEAKTLIAEAGVKADTIVIVDSPDEDARAANKAAIDEIKTIMKSIQEKLVSAIKLLK